MKEPIFLIGAGGLGREVAAWLSQSTDFDVKGFYDDLVPKGSVVNKWPVVGKVDDLLGANTMNLLITIGDPRAKDQLALRLSSNKNLVFPAVVHPRAEISDRSALHLGAGSIISAGCVLTVDIKLGDHVLLNINCTIGHDATIGHNTSIMPGANLAGAVSIGKNVLVGSGAQIINRVSVADNARVGAGAVVIEDVAASTTVVGVPARPVAIK